jgi:hypothetical protein
LAVIPIAVAIGVLVTLAWVWMRRRRRTVVAIKAAPGESELLRLYERLQRNLGRRRAPPETPLEYFHAPLPDGDRGLLEDVTQAVNEGAYAGRWPDRERLDELSRRLS